MSDPVNALLPGAQYYAYMLLIVTLLCWFRWKHHVSRFWRYILIVSSIWAWVFAAPAFSNLLTRSLENAVPANSLEAATRMDDAYVIVLASGRMVAGDGTPSPRMDEAGWERLRYGVQLWKKTGGTLLFSGGPDNIGIDQTMAGLMQQVANELGVPRSAMSLSTKSETTFQDLSEARRRVPQSAKHVYLVTSAIHMPRALAVAKQVGIEVTPMPCDYRQLLRPTWRAWFPDDGGPSLWYDALHEWIGLHVYRLQGKAQ
jgi:uncharacterized SAM-binding protein YcdF (DUF218 family)